MDKSKFTDAATGHLVQIDLEPGNPKRTDWAFIPAELPPKWEMTPELWNLASTAAHELGNLNGAGRILEDPELLLRPLQNSEAMASSRIEGTFVSAQQLLLYAMDQKEPGTKKAKDDWLEVFNYSDALKIACSTSNDVPITGHLVRSLHQRLLWNTRGHDKSPGKFRECQVRIGSTGRYIPPPHSEVNRLVNNLEQYVASDTTDTHPLVKCFLVHYQFEAIHPFEDGNGRVGRMLLAYMIYRAYGHSRPWLYLSEYFDRFQDEYFSKLFNVSAIGDWSSWVELCLNGTISQAVDSIRRCDQFSQLQQDFYQRVLANGTPRSRRIIDGLFQEPMLTVASVKKLINKNRYETAKADIDKLVQVGILRELQDHRPKTYYSPEIMAIAYGRQQSP